MESTFTTKQLSNYNRAAKVAERITMKEFNELIKANPSVTIYEPGKPKRHAIVDRVDVQEHYTSIVYEYLSNRTGYGKWDVTLVRQRKYDFNAIFHFYNIDRLVTVSRREES